MQAWKTIVKGICKNNDKRAWAEGIEEGAVVGALMTAEKMERERAERIGSIMERCERDVQRARMQRLIEGWVAKATENVSVIRAEMSQK